MAYEYLYRHPATPLTLMSSLSNGTRMCDDYDEDDDDACPTAAAGVIIAISRKIKVNSRFVQFLRHFRWVSMLNIVNIAIANGIEHIIYGVRCVSWFIICDWNPRNYIHSISIDILPLIFSIYHPFYLNDDSTL